MKLYALMDFPDDAQYIYHASTMYAIMQRLARTGVSRVYLQYYGNRDYGHVWTNTAPDRQEPVRTARNLPEYARVFVEAAREAGLETAVIMRPQEQGSWLTWSPYYREARGSAGVDFAGGKMLIISNFLKENPHLRIKRRSYDLDTGAVNRTIRSIKLYKQNNRPFRFSKDHIALYVSQNNAHYTQYRGSFDVSIDIETARSDVQISAFRENYPTETLTRKGDAIQVMTLSGLNIPERYAAVRVRCDGPADKTVLFRTNALNGMMIFDETGAAIQASHGAVNRYSRDNRPPLDIGFHFNDGFGVFREEILDPPDEDGYLAICKGRDAYVHAALCACEPEVREYWLHWLNRAMDDGFDMAGNRIECHSIHVNDPTAFGYNACIKAEYFRRYGRCDEAAMDTAKIAVIRGDAYTEYLRECCVQTRKRGVKFTLTLNLEMLRKPLPSPRWCAYPMNVEWQWERWLEETDPDEIIIRTYQTSPASVLADAQCRRIIGKAAKRGRPMVYERYDYWDFAADFELIRKTGLFEGMTLYETNNIIRSDGEGGITDLKPDLLLRLAELTGAS